MSRFFFLMTMSLLVPSVSLARPILEPIPNESDLSVSARTLVIESEVVFEKQLPLARTETMVICKVGTEWECENTSALYRSLVEKAMEFDLTVVLYIRHSINLPYMLLKENMLSSSISEFQIYTEDIILNHKGKQ